MIVFSGRLALAQGQGERLAGILEGAKAAPDSGDRIVAISARFLGVPYVANTLIGGPNQPERLVIDLDGFDCFTLLDTVEALRRSAAADQFRDQLRMVRYRHGVVDYRSRRHFFSDWVAAKDGPVADVTVQVAPGRAVRVSKWLNRKQDGRTWLAGISVRQRDIFYIPTTKIDGEVLAALHSGDYVGFYSDRAGLDVSHTGLIVRQNGRVTLRHASSRSGARKVVDDDLLAYLQGKPGLVVYRVKP